MAISSARQLWIKIHLYLAAFFLPMLLAVCVSGGLHLLSVKGSVESSPVPSLVKAESWKQTLQSTDANTVDGVVRDILSANDIDYEFEYVKVSVCECVCV
jgi:uncharacterized iron-regulated membrane protein